MEKYSFFDAILGSDGSYDRTYSSADMASYFASFIGNGVYANPANSLMVVEKAGTNQVQVLPGKAWVNGYFYELDTDPKLLSVSIGDTMNPRIDTVVLALDLSKRLIEINVVKGAASVSPKAKEPVRTATRYELVLAEITVEPGSTKIQQKNIKDKRPDEAVCGIVKGVVEEIDTNQLFAQYDDEFYTWFETMKGSLEGDVAANLSSQIASISNDVNLVKRDVNALPKIRSGVPAPDNNIGVDGDIYIQILE